MKKYVSTTRWRDLKDNHLYNVGDEYPYDGRKVSDERIAELTSDKNRAGFALVTAVEIPEKPKPVENTTEAEKPQKKAAKSRKKAE